MSRADRSPWQGASDDAATRRSACPSYRRAGSKKGQPDRRPLIRKVYLINFFNAKRPVTVIVLGVVFAACGVFYGLSPSESGVRPPQQIITGTSIAALSRYGRVGAWSAQHPTRSTSIASTTRQ